jgi:hypothetical protein
MWKWLLSAGIAAMLATFPAAAADFFTVSACEDGGRLPVIFQIDCSNVADPHAKALCPVFLRNQACRVFPAYRQITGIRMEQFCPSLTYTIYDQDKWPEQGGEAGGLALRCAVHYMTQYSVGSTSSAPFGPYDTHEILHEYHEALGAIPYQHILFSVSQPEVMRLVGDTAAYDKAIARMKQEVSTFDQRSQMLAQRGGTIDQCVLAEVQVEEQLYLADRRNVYRFYQALGPARSNSQADREARFNRMYDKVSGGRVRAFLLAHGCAPF